MVVKIAPYSGKALHYGNMELSEFCLIAEARLHQQLRCLNGAKRKDDFKRSSDADNLSLVGELHARRALPVKKDACNHRPR
jgi:hypothetical protein